MRRLYFVAAILTLTTACSAEEKPVVDLSLACQLNECVCVQPDRPFYEKPEPQPVLWKENGDAYCPDGLALELADKLKK